MNADELKRADEMVRALRDYASDCDDGEACHQCTFEWVCDECDGNAPKIIADLIESLTAQLAESQRREKAAVEDLEAILALACAAEVEGICNYCSDDGENCTGTTGWRGPQEAEKGEADEN